MKISTINDRSHTPSPLYLSQWVNYSDFYSLLQSYYVLYSECFIFSVFPSLSVSFSVRSVRVWLFSRFCLCTVFDCEFVYILDIVFFSLLIISPTRVCMIVSVCFTCINNNLFVRARSSPYKLKNANDPLRPFRANKHKNTIFFPLVRSPCIWLRAFPFGRTATNYVSRWKKVEKATTTSGFGHNTLFTFFTLFRSLFLFLSSLRIPAFIFCFCFVACVYLWILKINVYIHWKLNLLITGNRTRNKKRQAHKHIHIIFTWSTDKE